MASKLVQIRVDKDLKNEATSIFEQIGLDLPTAFRIFLKKSVEEKKHPVQHENGKKSLSLKKAKRLLCSLEKKQRKTDSKK